jgi:hypothetical protein
MIIDDLGNMSENIGIMACGESLLSWPARIMEEMKLTVQYHLTRQFELNL